MQFESPPIELKAGLATTKERAHPVFWFQNPNGEYFFTQEPEAWEIFCGRIKIHNGEFGQTVRHKYLGRSTGEIYFSGLAEMKQIFKEKGLEEAQNFLKELEEKERLSADPNIKPRNFDKILNGMPAKFQV